MRKNKYFIKRKNTYLHETVIERGSLWCIKQIFLLGITLISSWLFICFTNAIFNG